MQAAIVALLMDVESELRTLGLWDRIPPSAKALASDLPFCVDTLTLSQWLQFIFLPSIYQLMGEGGQLPSRCAIAPMAEEYFKGSELATDALIFTLKEIDSTLSAEGVKS